MVDISIVVMAHPKRRAWAEQLAGELDCPIVWDEQNVMWDTGRRALLAGLGMGGTHHLVIQDDCVLSDGLTSVLADVVKDGPVCLYAGNNRTARLGMELARKHGRAWWRYNDLVWGPAILQPVNHLQAVVEFGDRVRIRSYDQRLTAYWKRQKNPCWYTAPSLVNHRKGDNPSLKGGPDTRDACWFGTGVGVDWATEPVMLDKDTLNPVVEFHYGRFVKKVRYGTSIYRRLMRNGQWELTDESRRRVEWRLVDA